MMKLVRVRVRVMRVRRVRVKVRVVGFEVFHVHVLAEVEARPDRCHVARGDVAASDDHAVLAVEARRRKVVVQRRNLEAGKRIEHLLAPLPN